MKNICLIGLNNAAPTELHGLCAQKYYYYFAPTELLLH
jgi:hypothetical protein